MVGAQGCDQMGKVKVRLEKSRAATDSVHLVPSTVVQATGQKRAGIQSVLCSPGALLGMRLCSSEEGMLCRVPKSVAWAGDGPVEDHV